MLYSTRDVQKCTIQATDGELGKVHDLFFDDRTWDFRYVVVDTGKWLPGKRVLVPRASIVRPDWSENELRVDLTREQIENSPGIDADPPLALDEQSRYYQSYVWTSYAWGGFIGGATTPLPPRKVTEGSETHLRSVREITGYHIEARDGSIGHVEDFLFAREDWAVRYLVIDTRNWLPGKKVVIPPSEIGRMDWTQRNVHVGLGKDEIENAPRLEPYSKAFGPRLMVIK